MITVTVELPAHLRNLARIQGPVPVEVPDAPTIQDVLDALEEGYPTLRGTIREHATRERRAFMRYFAGGRDLSHDPPNAPLPPEVAAGAEPFRVIGAIAGGRPEPGGGLTGSASRSP